MHVLATRRMVNSWILTTHDSPVALFSKPPGIYNIRTKKNHQLLHRHCRSWIHVIKYGFQNNVRKIIWGRSLHLTKKWLLQASWQIQSYHLHLISLINTNQTHTHTSNMDKNPNPEISRRFIRSQLGTQSTKEMRY